MNVEWHWIAADGREVTGSQSELEQHLARRELLPATLVKQSTWLSWLPANRVAPLAGALKASEQERPAPTEPRVAPVYLETPVPNASVPYPTLSNRIKEQLQAQDRAAAFRREPFPTLADDAPPATTTLRPPGAVPPPARGAITGSASAPKSGPKVVGTPPNPDLRDATPKRTEQRAQDSTPQAEANVGVQRSAAHMPHPGETPLIPTRSARPLIVGLAVLSGSLALLLSIIVVTRSSSTPPLAPSTSTPMHAPFACEITAPAARLAASVERSVQPVFANLKDEQVAVGFAATRTQAAGIVVDARTLDVTPSYEQSGERPLSAVVPVRSSELTFIDDRDGARLSNGRSFENLPGISLGFSDSGLARQGSGDGTRLLWKGVVDAVTEPRVAPAGSFGHAIAFRQGGLGGKLWVGWLHPDLTLQTELAPVQAGVRWVGTPAIAANPSALLLVVAGRDEPSAAWRLRLGTAAKGALPKALEDFVVPEGGNAGGALAPAIASMGEQRWLLQWTQGKPGNYQVRVQALGSDLQPDGPPLLASPKGASAGQGALWVLGERALSLYVLTVGGRDELWGAAFTCR